MYHAGVSGASHALYGPMIEMWRTQCTPVVHMHRRLPCTPIIMSQLDLVPPTAPAQLLAISPNCWSGMPRAAHAGASQRGVA